MTGKEILAEPLQPRRGEAEKSLLVLGITKGGLRKTRTIPPQLRFSKPTTPPRGPWNAGKVRRATL